MGLDLPPARKIVNELAAKTAGFESSALTIEEAAEDIRKYLRKC